jgi:RHS repeat-associated protein
VSTKNRVTNTGFTYDNAGNLTFDGLLNYTWDAENHLKSTNGVNYTYDGDLRRVEKSNGKLYWYSGGQVLEETDLSGNLLNDYVYFAGQRIARRDSSANVFYYYTDPLVGSTLAIYQSSGSLCYQGVYYPFGGEKVYTNTCAQNYKFTGLERDTESGLDKTANRMYTSNMGRWLSPDPLGGQTGKPQSLNRYAYVLNNPTTLNDPLGLYTGAGSNPDPLPPPYSPPPDPCPNGEWINGVLICNPPTPPSQPPGPVPGSGNDGGRDPGCLGAANASTLVLSFYALYGSKLNDCIEKVFGKDSKKVPTQTFFNSPNVNTSLSEAQVGQTTNNPTAPAVGSNNPSCGPNGTTYIANTLCNKARNAMNAFWGTYVHELGNLLDEELNYHGQPGFSYSTYGDPNSPDKDRDTGAALERCVFGKLQYPNP